MDTNDRLKRLLKERGWTEYRLSKNSGLAETTIGNIFRRNTVPSIPTLEIICKSFGIKLVDCLEKCLIYGHIRRFAN